MLTVVDAVLVARLPFQGEGADAIGAMLLAGFFNLLAVALVAPVLGMLLRRRRRDLPFMIARDYAGTALLVVITVRACSRAGWRTARRWSTSAPTERAVFAAVHDYVVASEPRVRRRPGRAEHARLEPEHYRACVDGPGEAPDLPVRQHRPVPGRGHGATRRVEPNEPALPINWTNDRWTFGASARVGPRDRIHGFAPSLSAAASLVAAVSVAVAARDGRVRRPRLAGWAGVARRRRGDVASGGRG